MILATDVGYNDTQHTALAAGVLFSDWDSTTPLAETSIHVEGIAPYEPGAFYKRELPCLVRLVEWAHTQGELSLVVVDGYVDLEPCHDGLGRHLYRALREIVPVVGVAKSFFHGSEGVPVMRGISKSPLYVTAAGMSATDAAEAVRKMHGEHRLPTLLQRTDAISKGRG